MSYNIYISTDINKNIREVVDIANQHNLNIEIKSFTKKYNLSSIDNLLPDYKSALNKFEGVLSLHAPFDAVYKLNQRDKKRELALARYNQALYLAKKLNAKTVIFHTGFSPLKERISNYRQEFIKEQAGFWKNFIKHFENAGIIAVLENTNENNPDVLIGIVDEVNSDNLKLCIDTGHANLRVITMINVLEWIKRENGRLYHMHLHNNYGLIDEHNSLLKGSVNFKEIFDTLKENHLSPNLSLEISNYSDVMESVKFIRNNFK